MDFRVARQIISSCTDALRAGYLACIVESGDNKGTISVAKPRLKASNSVRQHRVISISYKSVPPCHGRGRGFESRRPRHFLSSTSEETGIHRST